MSVCWGFVRNEKNKELSALGPTKEEMNKRRALTCHRKERKKSKEQTGTKEPKKPLVKEKDTVENV